MSKLSAPKLNGHALEIHRPLPERVVRFALLLLALFAADRFVAPNLNPYVVRMMVLAGINVILAVSLNLINGFTGQFSLGHAGFMAIGAYTSAYFAMNAGPRLLALFGATPAAPGPAGGTLVLFAGLFLGGLTAAVAGLLIGMPTLRLKGDYLAIATLGFGEIIRAMVTNTGAIGGATGYPNIPPYTTFFWAFVVVSLAVGVHWNLVKSRHGRAFLAVREDEVAAESLGIPTTRYKVMAFTIGAAFAGMAGGLFAHYTTYLSPNHFTFIKSIEVVIMVVLGGMGSITGSVFGAVVLTLLPEVLRPIRDYRMVIYSLLLVVLMITRPQGIFGLGEWRPTLPFRRAARTGAR